MRLFATLAVTAIVSAQDLPFLRAPPSHVTVATKVTPATLTSEDSPTSPAHSTSEDSPTSSRSSKDAKRPDLMRSVRLVTEVTPKPNIHVYAPGADGYQAVTLTLDPRPGITAGKVRYPKSELLMTGAERVPAFGKRFQLTLPITIDRKSAGAAPMIVSGRLLLQACDDQVCYKPETVAVSWEIPR